MIDKSIEVILEILSPLLRTVWKIAYKFTKRGRKGAIIASTIFLIILAVPVIILFILIYKGIVYLTSQRNHFLIITASPVPILLIIVFKIFIKLIKQVTKLRDSPLSSGKKIKSIEDVETAIGRGEMGELFKLGWLYKKDIEKTEKMEKIDELIQKFKKYKAVLLKGPPASGKTVIAKQFGFEMAKRGYFVYYANLTVRKGLGKNVTPETLPDKLKEELKDKLNVDVYIIIEDVHYYPEKYKEMAWVTNNKSHIKLLLVSRPLDKYDIIGRKLAVKEEDFFEESEGDKKSEKFSKIFFGANVIQITAAKAMEKIIKKAQEDGIQVDDINKIKKFAERNLYILIFAIKAAKKKKKTLDKIDNEDIMDQVDEYILGGGKDVDSLLMKVSKEFNGTMNSEQKEKFKEILKFLSVISQYELPVKEETLARYARLKEEYVEKYLTPLAKHGDVVKIKRQGSTRHIFIVPHSKLAESMADVLINPDTPYDEKLEILRFYLKHDDYPGTLIFRVKYGEGKKLSEFFLSHLDKSDFEDIKNRELDIIEISFILYALASSEVGKKFIETFGDKIKSISLSEQNLSNITIFLTGLSLIDINLAKEIIHQHKNDLISISLSKILKSRILAILSGILY